MSIEARFHLDYAGFTLDVNLTLPGRGVTALFGQSGSGKTTLLRCIAGLEHAPGELRVNGDIWQNQHTSLPTHQRPMGYVFQEASLFAHLTVLGNVRYGMTRSAAAQPVKLDHVIKLLGINHLLDRKPDRLSGGERQRVAIARALAVSPKLLLMDEPLAALDHARKQEILPYLQRLHDELEIPVLYVSHAPDEVARLADYLVVLDAGRVTASGKLGEVLSRLDLPIRLGEDTGAILEGVIAEVDAHWHLARVDFAGGRLWTRDHGLAPGHAVRVRVLARDVSLATEEPKHTSIQNHWPCILESIAPDTHPAQVLVRVRCGPAALLARITRRALHTLQLQSGDHAWAQVKSVALL